MLERATPPTQALATDGGLFDAMAIEMDLFSRSHGMARFPLKMDPYFQVAQWKHSKKPYTIR